MGEKSKTFDGDITSASEGFQVKRWLCLLSIFYISSFEGGELLELVCQKFHRIGMYVQFEIFT